MKHHFYLFLFLLLFGCDNSMEDIYRYSKLISQSKDYPVYLDMSIIGRIMVTTELTMTAPFKIVSNENYYFVGDMHYGIHVYEKNAGSVNYLCSIECSYIKDFELIDNLLFCNNLVNLIIIDVSNPLNMNVLHREEYYFNHFTDYKESWNIPYEEGKGLIAGTESHILFGMVTEKEPDLDFSEYDQLFGNLLTKDIPGSWFSNQPEYDKPYIGMVKMGSEQIYSYGSYNSWAICSFLSGTFSEREEDLWTTPWGNYAPPYYYSDAFPVRMFYEDSIIYILGKSGNSGYSDCIIYNESYPETFHLYFPDSNPLDITYFSSMNAFLVLSGQSVWGAFKSSDPTQGNIERYFDYNIQTEARSVFRKGNNLITLGDKLTVYLPSESELLLVKDYPDISGICCSKAGDILAVANTQGLFLYDINDLENIQLIP